jgi:hypothetical protein
MSDHVVTSLNVPCTSWGISSGVEQGRAVGELEAVALVELALVDALEACDVAVAPVVPAAARPAGAEEDCKVDWLELSPILMTFFAASTPTVTPVTTRTAPTAATMSPAASH